MDIPENAWKFGKYDVRPGAGKAARMKVDLFQMSGERHITLCGTNIYPFPEYHVDRILDEHDLMYVHEGTWQVAQDGVIYDLKAGDVILLRAGSHHWGTAPCSVGSRNMFIHFEKRIGDRLGAEMSSAEILSYAKGPYFCVPTLVSCGIGTEVGDLFRQVVQVYWGHRDDRDRTLCILLDLILNELAADARNTVPASEDWILELLHIFSAQPGRFLSLTDAARIAGMGERTFSARFRKIMGKSFHSYQMETKLEKAYEMLRTGHYSVKETATEYGFSDPYYFSRVFTKRFGTAPSEIRRGEPSENVNRPRLK